MLKLIRNIVLVMAIVTAVAAGFPQRNVYPEEDIKRYQSLTDVIIGPGSDQGQMLYWDATTMSWLSTATPPAADRITFWDNSADP